MSKNKLIDLNNHLFAQLERLNDEDLSPEDLRSEIARASAITHLGKTIVTNARLVLDATIAASDMNTGESGRVSVPAMLTGKVEPLGGPDAIG